MRALEDYGVLLYFAGLVCLHREMKAGSMKPDIEKHRFCYSVAVLWFFILFHGRQMSYRFAVQCDLNAFKNLAVICK